jgi:hypothetical protein
MKRLDAAVYFTAMAAKLMQRLRAEVDQRPASR